MISDIASLYIDQPLTLNSKFNQGANPLTIFSVEPSEYVFVSTLSNKAVQSIGLILGSLRVIHFMKTKIGEEKRKQIIEANLSKHSKTDSQDFDSNEISAILSF